MRFGGIPENFRGSILIDAPQFHFARSMGFAHLADRVPNTPGTKFATASAGKAFVAVAILQLIDKGTLHFTDRLGELLAGVSLGQIDPDVTVRQLLNHTAGVPDYFDESVMNEYEELWSDFPNYRIRHNADLFPLFIDKPMLYPKGTRFQYNNSGYVLLAAILESISGHPFDQYLQQNVFDPCGMENTGYYELDRLPAKCAENYIYCPETNSYRTNIFSVDVKGTGAGGAFTTTGDILRFWNGLREYRLLSREMAEEAFKKQAQNGDSDSEEGAYGFGFWIMQTEDGREIPYFQGSDPGVSFLSEYDPLYQRVTVLISNYGDNVWSLRRALRASLDKESET